MIYELWNTRTRNLVDSFATKAAALSAARKIIESNGSEYANRLALAQEDKRGNTRLIAAGADLVEQIERAAASTAGASRTTRNRRRRASDAQDRPVDAQPTVFADRRGD